MKKITLLITSLFIVLFTFSQENQNTIIQTNDSINSEITKKEINFDEYGGKFSTGIALGGGGIIGIPLRFYFTPKIAIEAGAYLRPKALHCHGYTFHPFYDSFNFWDISAGVMVVGGTIIYFKKYYKSRRKKIKLNGISIKGGQSFSYNPESFFSLGWAHESFRKNNKDHSFIFELGFGVLLEHNNYSPPKGLPLIYWKLHWNWYNK